MKLQYIPKVCLVLLLLTVIPVDAQYDPETIHYMAWRPDGQVLATGLVNSTTGIALYAPDGSFLQSITTEAAGEGISWSPDGSLIGGHTRHDGYQIFDATSGLEVLRFDQIGSTLNNAIYWHPGGMDQIATVAGTVVFIRDATTGEVLFTLVSPDSRTDDVVDLVWYANGSRILTASMDDVLRVWDVDTGAIVTEFQQSYQVRSMAVNAEVTQAAIGSNDGMVRLVDLTTGAVLSTFEVLVNSPVGNLIYNIEWQPNGDKIAAASFEAITVWDNARQQVSQIIPLPEGNTRPDSVVYAPNGQLTYAATGTGFVIAPLAEAGLDQSVTDSDGDGSEAVVLDGSASVDSNGTIVMYAWHKDGIPIATGIDPQVSLAVGVHTLILTVTDDEGQTDNDAVVITVDSES